MRLVLLDVVIILIILGLLDETDGGFLGKWAKKIKDAGKNVGNKIKNAGEKVNMKILMLKLKNIKRKLRNGMDKKEEKQKYKDRKKKIKGTDSGVPRYPPLKFVETQTEQFAEKFSPQGEIVEGDLKNVGAVKELREGKITRDKVLTGEDGIKWPSTTIPIDTDKIDKHTSDMIQLAINDFNDFTCIRFVPRQNEPDYIKIIPGTGCWSYLGHMKGEQELSLGAGCGYKGTVVHMLMHALGFLHEHTRPDRDNYIKVDLSNVIPGKESNFDTYERGNGPSSYGTPYDYLSIMHVDSRFFSKISLMNIPAATIRPTNPMIDVDDLGQRSGFSETDINQIKKSYCPEKATTTTTTTTTTPTTTTTTTTTTEEPLAAPGLTTIAPTTPVVSTTALTTHGGVTVPAADKNATTTEAPVTKVITLIPGETPTKTPTTKPSTTTTTTYAPYPGYCIQSSDISVYPCWPQDFVWSNNGLPTNCNCNNGTSTGTCRCNCVRFQGSNDDKTWSNNYLCHKDTDKNPNMKWSKKGKMPGKKCVKITEPREETGWDNNYFCIDKNAPYHFKWSNDGELREEAVKCMNINEPEDENGWDNNYLCASTEL